VEKLSAKMLEAKASGDKRAFYGEWEQQPLDNAN
jgi:hypothetical protein